MIRKLMTYSLLLLMAAFIQNNLFAQGKKQCEESISLNAEKNIKSRGADHFKIDNSKISIIPEELAKSRGSNSCYLAIENKTDLDVNVFVDSTYVGYIEPMKKGMISRGKGYSIIHCWSVDGYYKWTQKGNCDNCMKRFVLNLDRNKK